MEESNKAREIKKITRNVRTFIIILAFVGIVLAVALNIENINMDNLRRLFAKIDISLNNSYVSNDEVRFNSDSQNRFAMYKGGLSFVTKDGLVICDDKGNEINTIEATYKTPAIETGKKYILIYDRGGSSFKLTNSFAMLYEETFSEEEPIYKADINDKGQFVLLNGGDGYKYMITAYSSSFSVISKIYISDMYVVDCDISHKGNMVAVCALSSDNGTIKSVIRLYKLEDETLYKEIEIENTVFDIDYKNNGNLVCYTSDKFIFINSQGEIINEYDFKGMQLSQYSYDSDRYSAAVLLDGLSDKTPEVNIFDEKGNLVINGNVSEEIIACSFYDEGLAVMTKHKLICIAASKNEFKVLKTVEHETDYDTMLASGGKAVMIGGNYAKIISLK